MNEPKKHYPNSGTINPNERKESQSHSDENGSVHITCPKCGKESEFWISGWYKTGFMSLSFREKLPRPGGDRRPQRPAATAAAEAPRAEKDDDVPF